ncbi:MAG: hypothetical protein IPL46_16745 [Saprospiraceae bacterium]|nr:hypothetical protein [Saprospiraceae bacterium]
MTKTLAAQLKPFAVDFNTLHKSYSPVLSLVRVLIGVVPNCDTYLEIWPTGFKTYNLLVPNMLNLPATLFGRKRTKALMGLAMYRSSMAAECPYCSAHTCSYALRRGATPDAITGIRSPQEQAVVALAEGMSRIPFQVSKSEYQAFTEQFHPVETEKIVLSIGLMGFLNKFMDAIGVELEQESINDVGKLLSGTEWRAGKHVSGPLNISSSTIPKQDNLMTYLRVIRQGPGADSLERGWTRGVPDSYPKAGEFLLNLTGHNFPFLAHFSQKRIVRALTTVLRDNLDKSKTVLGMTAKCLAGYMFSRVIFNHSLSVDLRKVAAQLTPEVNESVFDQLDELAELPAPGSDSDIAGFYNRLSSNKGLTKKDITAVLLSRGASSSPADVNDHIIDQVGKWLEPTSVVELVVWLSVLQLVHRLENYFAIAQGSSRVLQSTR